MLLVEGKVGSSITDSQRSIITTIINKFRTTKLGILPILTEIQNKPINPIPHNPHNPPNPTNKLSQRLTTNIIHKPHNIIKKFQDKNSP